MLCEREFSFLKNLWIKFRMQNGLFLYKKDRDLFWYEIYGV